MALVTIESKNAAVTKLNTLIENGRAHAQKVIEHVLNNQPTDYLNSGRDIKVVRNEDNGSLAIEHFDEKNNPVRHTLHRNALSQLANTADLPVRFVDSLETVGPWGRDLLRHNLQTILHERFAKKKFLLRTLNGQARGILSDSYRRIDSRATVEAFAEAVQQKGAMPYDGIVTDTKIALQAIMPEVYEPVPGEVVAYGLSLENSDFGVGPVSVRAYLLRIWCTNLAVTQETMRQVHLGARLDQSVFYSRKTYELDARTTVSALRDVIKTQLDATSLARKMESIRVANDQTLSTEEAHNRLKKVLQKGDAEDVEKAFVSSDTYNMPAGKTLWRLSNAISWVANQVQDNPERKLELQKLAGSVLPTDSAVSKDKAA